MTTETTTEITTERTINDIANLFDNPREARALLTVLELPDGRIQFGRSEKNSFSPDELFEYLKGGRSGGYNTVLLRTKMAESGYVPLIPEKVSTVVDLGNCALEIYKSRWRQRGREWSLEDRDRGYGEQGEKYDRRIGKTKYSS